MCSKSTLIKTKTKTTTKQTNRKNSNTTSHSVLLFWKGAGQLSRIDADSSTPKQGSSNPSHRPHSEKECWDQQPKLTWGWRVKFPFKVRIKDKRISARKRPSCPRIWKNSEMRAPLTLKGAHNHCGSVQLSQHTQLLKFSVHSRVSLSIQMLHISFLVWSIPPTVVLKISQEQHKGQDFASSYFVFLLVLENGIIAVWSKNPYTIWVNIPDVGRHAAVSVY